MAEDKAMITTGSAATMIRRIVSQRREGRERKVKMTLAVKMMRIIHPMRGTNNIVALEEKIIQEVNEESRRNATKNLFLATSNTKGEFSNNLLPPVTK